MNAFCCATLLTLLAPREQPDRLAATYVDAVRAINTKHAQRPGKTREDELAKLVPDKARRAFEVLVKLEDPEGLVPALEAVANAALELDLELDFAAARERIVALDANAAARLGVLVSRPRVQVRGVGGLDPESCERFADLFEAILGAYDELFGFAEYSKVPGKKLRALVHLEKKIERPPHFAPQFEFHSAIDFPVVDAHTFRSPTADGKFLFYGLCHELGHVVTMWGDTQHEEDHHAWAHYTGVAVVEHLSKDPRHAKLLHELTDVRWRSLEKEREAAQSAQPGRDSYANVMALWIELHDSVGPKAIGDALDLIDADTRRLRVNRVRYTTFDSFRDALLEVIKTDAQRKRVRELLR